MSCWALTLELLFDGDGIAFMFSTSLRLSSEYSASAKLGPSSKEGVMKLDCDGDDDDEVWRRVSHPRSLQLRLTSPLLRSWQSASEVCQRVVVGYLLVAPVVLRAPVAIVLS